LLKVIIKNEAEKIILKKMCSTKEEVEKMQRRRKNEFFSLRSLASSLFPTHTFLQTIYRCVTIEDFPPDVTD
jgi:hypothetical protein